MNRTDPEAKTAAPSVSACDLSKQFGTKIAVNRLSLDIFPGQIVGLVGPNGAGKSTLLRLLTGVVAPSSGSATVCGFDVASQPIEVKRRIGFAPESDAVFESLTGREFLETVASLHAVSYDLARDRISRMGDLFDLTDRVLDENLLGTYSKGMRRKIIIASALLHNPSVALFDEPLDGLDPNASIGFKALIRMLANEGKTIVYSSHLLDVIERICTRVIILDRGNIVMDGTPGDLMSSQKSSTLELLFTQMIGGDGIQGKVEAASRALIHDSRSENAS